jgi:hypothetical protein
MVLFWELTTAIWQIQLAKIWKCLSSVKSIQWCIHWSSKLCWCSSRSTLKDFPCTREIESSTFCVWPWDLCRFIISGVIEPKVKPTGRSLWLAASQIPYSFSGPIKKDNCDVHIYDPIRWRRGGITTCPTWGNIHYACPSYDLNEENPE